MVAPRGPLGVEVARKRDRLRRIVKLRDLRISALKLYRYTDAVEAFLIFEMHTFGQFASDMDSLDNHACEYVEALWQDMEPKAMACTTLAGIQHFLGRRRCLPRSWFMLSTWNLFDLPGRALPMSPKFVYTLVGNAFVQGHDGIAASIALRFAGFLRTGKMLLMQFQHLALYPTGGILTLSLTKIGRHRGHHEMVPIECPIVLRLVLLATRSAMPGDSIAPPPVAFRA